MFAVVAFFLAWMGTLGCQFIQFDLKTTSNYTTKDTINVHFGIWYRQSVELYNYTQSGGGGYYQVSTCTGYSDDFDTDTSWVAARAFSTLVLILGGIALLIRLVTCCCCMIDKQSENVPRVNGIIYLLVTLFQGLTLLILSSKLCQNNDDITKMENSNVIIYSFPDKCNLSRGAKCIISATVLWFFAGILSLYSYRAERRKMLEAKKKSFMIMDAAYSAEPLLP